jgi:3-hydroxy-9,10-secoandrosta-1,3,5(10)-triene-9,17-dione monooxygenase reductase component
MSFDSARFRTVLGHFPTGVTVITAAGADGPVGFTIGSFVSVSLDPPLVGFLPQKTSQTWAPMELAGSFCVNVLSAEQGELCWRFAKERDDKFSGVGWRPAPVSKAPLLDGALAWIDCTIEAVSDAGDHIFVLGRVHGLDAGDGDPQLFFRGKLGTFVER